jgi:hypothetical protein
MLGAWTSEVEETVAILFIYLFICSLFNNAFSVAYRI